MNDPQQNPRDGHVLSVRRQALGLRGSERRVTAKSAAILRVARRRRSHVLRSRLFLCTRGHEIHISASDESLDKQHARVNVSMSDDSGILAAETRGPCDRHIDARHVNTDIP